MRRIIVHLSTSDNRASHHFARSIRPVHLIIFSGASGATATRSHLSTARFSTLARPEESFSDVLD